MENEVFHLPLIREFRIENADQQMTNVDMKLFIQILKHSNALGLEGKKVTTLEIAEGKQGGTDFSLGWD